MVGVLATRDRESVLTGDQEVQEDQEELTRDKEFRRNHFLGSDQSAWRRRFDHSPESGFSPVLLASCKLLLTLLTLLTSCELTGSTPF